MGSVSMDLQIAPGVTINAVSWTIHNATSGFSRAGSVAVRFSNVISFQSGALPAASGYTIDLSATSVDGAFSCSGSAGFSISALAVTPVSVQLNCSTAPAGQGTVVVIGTTQVCANLDSLSASPLETAVNTPITLTATGSAGTLPVGFSWTASAGSFDDAHSAMPTFTCPATPGPVTITVTVSPSAQGCNTVTSQSVTVTCDTLEPTFTNVYATIIGQRCTGCHRPGGSGVTVGMLDMSTQAAAFTNLVGVNAQGIGAGTSGVTCASVMPPLARVAPGDASDSLLFNKVHSKLAGTNPPCGSPMPLPATATPLTQAEVDLISAWITAGAHND
ncbi:MAG TPA: c-type cytochrome [Kofleriaceae bacterium]|nr:c-type cytochrome [Kofleriaceae bacterium]